MLSDGRRFNFVSTCEPRAPKDRESKSTFYFASFALASLGAAATLRYPGMYALAAEYTKARAGMDLIRQFSEFFRHLDAHFQGPWLYLVVCLIVFCETGLVVTPILPGD